jgi:ssDNA-binding Zn-finger/Zn-ribbon topoisomerase 1
LVLFAEVILDNNRSETMHHTNHAVCPVCNGDQLILKYVATYEYSYIIDSNAPGLNNTKELLPHMYDNREQKENRQYIECSTCGTNYPCYFNKWTEIINGRAIQKAIDSAYLAKQINPE